MATTQNFNQIKDLRLRSLLIGDNVVIDENRNFNVNDITSRTIITNTITSKRSTLNFSGETTFKGNLVVGGNIDTEKIIIDELKTNEIKITNAMVCEGSLCFNEDLTVKNSLIGDITGGFKSVPSGSILCAGLIQSADGNGMIVRSNVTMQNDLQIGKPDKSCNTFMGFEAGKSLTNGNANTGLGHQVMQYLTSGSENTAVGKQSMQYIQKYGYSGYDGCVALGYQALRGPSSTPGPGNVAAETVAIGSCTLASFRRVTKSVAIGDQSLDNCAADGTVSLGLSACKNITNSYKDIAIGREALKDAKNTSETIAIGHHSSKNAENIDSQIAIGFRTAQNNYNCAKNTLVGNDSFTNLSFSYLNTAVGNFSLLDSTQLYRNVIIGTKTMNGVSNLDNNVFIGNYNYAASYCSYNISAGNYVMFDGYNTNTILLGYKSRVATNVSDIIGIGRNVFVDSQPYTITIGPYAKNYSTNQSMVIGGNSMADTLSSDSIVIGKKSSDVGTKNIVLGPNSSTIGTKQFVFGNNSQILSSTIQDTIILGSNSTISHGNVITFGHGASSDKDFDLVFENKLIEFTGNTGLCILPSQPATYLESKINGQRFKIPLYPI